jgi:4-hydroxy-tetrahydrodipicolinate synthase
MKMHKLSGVYAAAVTPLDDDLSPDAEGLVQLLEFLAGRGCHGALLLGTTGEGPSFSIAERLSILGAGCRIRETHPDFRLLAGVGVPALEDTIELARAAFDIDYDAVVVLPPYYYRNASDDGLLTWFGEVIRRAVPGDRGLLGYHIPGVSGVGLSIDLLRRLKDAYPHNFLGLKDSSADRDHALALGDAFGSDLLILNGTDRLLSDALTAGASGCITAMANLVSPDLRAVWDAHLAGRTDPAAQARLDRAREISERFPPAAALIKDLLAGFHGFPLWGVKPPLQPLEPERAKRARLSWKTRGKMVQKP